MWLFNKDTNTWVKQTDSLSLYNYNNLKQDLASVKLYSKALSGANYLAISDVNNIYESITYKDCKTWYIDPSSSIYLIGSIPSNGVSINRNSIDNFIKYTEEYGFTLKNNFTPEKAIDDMNLLQVDVATTQLIDLNSNIVSIDSVKLVEGNTILVKDQISTVDLSFTVDPAIYFEGNYYLVSNNISDDTYQYYSPDNGIYKYTNGKLAKSLLKDYGNYRDLSVNIKQGSINSGKQFHLSRLLNGYFPSEGDPIEFKEKHSYLVRHQTDYHNLFENNYLDVLKHGTQSLSIDSSIYTIPERLIYVGDFGVILVSQDGMQPQYLYNDYKYNLKNIIEVGENYWTCGDSGVILKISKVDLKICKVDLGEEFNTLTSIDFIDTLRGIAVGKYNTIYATFDGGYNWNKVSFDVQNYSYNKVIYYSYTTIYISGENGVFLELNYTDISSNKWSLTQRNIVKYLTTSDEYELIEDINTMFHASFTASWNLNYSGVTGLGISPLKDCLFFGTNNNNLIVYEINNFVPEFNFIYLSFSQSLGDITSVTLQEGTSNIIVSGNDTISFDVNQFNEISISSNLISSLGTFSLLSSTYSNQIFDYNGSVLYSACNMGVISGYDYTYGAFNIQAATVSPKFLLMEYDIADKLNFFDSNYNYVLPNAVTFSQFNGISSLIEINLDFDENTWLDYVSANVYKTYGINTGSLTDPVTLNSSFMYYTYSSITFSNSSICSDYTQFKGMYPYVGSTQSKYSTFTFASASVVSTLYAYKNIFIFNLSTDFCSVGDILQINAQDFKTNVMVNAYYTGGFFYAFNDINNSMMNSLLSTPVITLTNLNKFSDISDYTDLLINFQEHPFSTGYELTFNNSLFTVSPLFNNETAYKSLETNVYTQYSDISSNIFLSAYGNSYNSFGYVPNYNLLNYLNNINNVFTASKVFYTMPQYVELPGNNAGSFTYSNIYYDSNSGTSWPRNQIIFGCGLKYEWDTLWINTFVDLTITTTLGTYVKNQMLITGKYYDTNLDGYIVTFNDRILSVTNTGVISISIISRNSLEQISDDLKLFDSLNKPYINKSYNFNYYENPIKTKINTDSYTKILLADGDIKKYLTGVIYTNADNKLLLNTINVNTTRDIVINNTFNYASSLGLNTVANDVSTEQLAFIAFNGGTGSSQQLNPSYAGVHNINPIDDYNIYVNTPHLSDPSVSDTGLLRLYNFDPFFNYNPVSLIDVGFDGMYKIPIKLQENNLLKQGLSASLINYSTNKPVFRLLNGLDINQISTDYHWLLEAEITDGIIGLDTNGIVWYSGIWESGRWFGGTWYSGQWLSGDWYNGTWSSMYITDNIISIEIGKNTISNESSIWYNGRWFDGTWNGGTWLNGRRYNGDWNNGLWYNGIWNDGNWHKGQFMGGIWVQGNWDTGIFNSSNKPSFWINGKFNSGDFQNGMWYNGEFGQNYSVLSKFGTLASNSRNATWHGGVFASGNFYSYENISATDSTITVSDVHKYSVWKTGIFSQGNFYGGIVYNMNCQNGVWHGGIVQDIEIIGVSSPSASTVTLNGVFRFNIGDHINIIGDGSTTAYYNLGNYNNPGKYRIANSYIDLSKNWTVITLDYNFSTLAFTSPYNATASYNVNTGMRAVSRFKDINWKSGIFLNGIFEGGTFESGIWYDGVFNGSWG